MTSDSPRAEPGYSDIASANQIGDQIEIVFLNGDVVLLPPQRLGILGHFSVALAEDDDGLAITVATADAERDVTWSQIRGASDPHFAQEMRRQDVEESRRIGARLRALRLARGLSQKAVAASASMTTPQLSKIENGASDMRFSTVLALLRSMGATLDDIAHCGVEGASA